MIATVNEDVVQLYGTIYDGDGKYIVYELNRVFAKYNDVTVHIHTPGGDVFEGNLIYNTLAQTKSNVNIVIDGLSASMGSIIMLAGKKVSMASNAFVMIHAPWGSAFGTHVEMTSASKLLQSLEKVFVNQYAKRTGKTTNEVKQWMIGDNWFSAEEALEAGLIDEIIEPVLTESDDILQAESLKQMDLVALQKTFKAKFESTIQGSQTSNKPQIINQMKKQLISALGLQAVSETSSDTVIIEAIQNQIAQASSDAKAKDETIQQLKTEIKAFKDGAISGAVTTAIKAGKISEAQREKYENIGKTAGVETLNSILEDITGKPASITAQIQQGGKTDTNVEGSWDDLKKIPGALEDLKEKDLETFKALFQKKFGKAFTE